MSNSNFFTGFRLLIVEHPLGLLDKDDCIGLYLVSTERLKQKRKLEADLPILERMDDNKKYIMVIRDRIGEKSDRGVRVDEFSYIPDGIYTPVFESEAIIWNHGRSVAISEMLQDVQEKRQDETRD